MQMKNPPSSRRFRSASVYCAARLEHHGRCRRPRRDSHHAFGAGQWYARPLPGNGRAAIQGVRWWRRKLVGAASAIRSCARQVRSIETLAARTGVMRRWPGQSVRARDIADRQSSVDRYGAVGVACRPGAGTRRLNLRTLKKRRSRPYRRARGETVQKRGTASPTFHGP